jgi:multisubunit Na+/H+ antiporter MnhB subunit
MKMTPDRFGDRAMRLLFLGLVGGLGLLLMLVLQPAPKPAVNLAEQVRAGAAGVDNQVTAVLLNFRGYDTLLEMTVLLLAVLGVWALGPSPEPTTLVPVNRILLTLGRALIPLLVLTAGYLIWIGSYASGGALQAGALLGAGGVLTALTDRHIFTSLPVRLLRLSLALGLLVFLAIALGTMAAGGLFLQYPAGRAADLILAIECAAALSIGSILTALAAGGGPQSDLEKQGKSTTRSILT